MINVEGAFTPKTKSINDFYQEPGIGFYIPLYQREYSWDKENMNQLIEDISNGIENVTTDEDEIRFLGTIITVKEDNPDNKIEPCDPQGLPPRIDTVIDGQQRISTIALLATQIHHILLKHEKILPEGREETEELKEIINVWKDKLKDLFSLDLKRGEPTRKPKIIRSSWDKWVKKGKTDDNYTSEVTNFLAKYIDFIEEKTDEPPEPIKKHSPVKDNIEIIKDWLENTVANSHLNEESDFLSANEILAKIKESNVWQYQRDSLKEIIENETDDLGSNACSLLQIFSVCHYLLDRCCFTKIEPTREDWVLIYFNL
ncbi:MAG: DUF262 domain-containing protein [Flavobacteriales bacterium]